MGLYPWDEGRFIMPENYQPCLGDIIYCPGAIVELITKLPESKFRLRAHSIIFVIPYEYGDDKVGVEQIEGKITQYPFEQNSKKNVKKKYHLKPIEVKKQYSKVSFDFDDDFVHKLPAINSQNMIKIALGQCADRDEGYTFRYVKNAQFEKEEPQRFFNFYDKYGCKLVYKGGMCVVDDNTGFRRDFDPDNDSVKFNIKTKILSPDDKYGCTVVIFESALKSLFDNKTAKEFFLDGDFDKYWMELTDNLLFDVVVSIWVNTGKNKEITRGWNVENIYKVEDGKDFQNEEDDEDCKPEEDNEGNCEDNKHDVHDKKVKIQDNQDFFEDKNYEGDEENSVFDLEIKP